MTLLLQVLAVVPALVLEAPDRVLEVVVLLPAVAAVRLLAVQAEKVQSLVQGRVITLFIN